MPPRRIIALGATAMILSVSGASAGELRRLPRSELLDRIRGGWAGQMIGNVQGLPFEFKHKDAPGPLPDFTPDLAICRSDDDTDIEWTHLHAMDRTGSLLVPYPELAREWVRSINRGIWVSNEQARKLIGKGTIPPWTSHFALNPHAAYNLSGQFCAESYGYLAPGLPNEAAKLGAYYTKITVRGEPIQACAFTTSMIALAFFERNMERLIAMCKKPSRNSPEHVASATARHAGVPGLVHSDHPRLRRACILARGTDAASPEPDGFIAFEPPQPLSQSRPRPGQEGVGLPFA